MLKLNPFIRLWKATIYSLKGLKAAYIYEEAFRLELIVSVIVLPAGFLLGKTGVERALLIGSWLLVLVIELLNSAVETIVDRISMENHELAGRAKDIGSASVMAAIFVAMVVWVLILISPISTQ